MECYRASDQLHVVLGLRFRNTGGEIRTIIFNQYFCWGNVESVPHFLSPGLGDLSVGQAFRGTLTCPDIDPGLLLYGTSDIYQDV
jgi:hypothetical protein